MKRLLVLGAGTGGSMLANKLVRALDPRAWQVAVVDQDDDHVYQPGLLLLPFGTYRPRQLVKSRRALLDAEVDFVLGEVAGVDTAARTVALADGRTLGWDLLVVATGAHPRPDKVPGLLGEGWGAERGTFYTLPGAIALAERLRTFERGRLVVHVADLPIKCPVAPLEFAFLADAFLRERGVRDQVELVYATPLDGAFTKPVASRVLGGMMQARGIMVESELVVERVDGPARTVHAYDGRALDYDLLVSIPMHLGAPGLEGSGLVDDLGFVTVDRHTLQSTVHPDVFGVGDATNAPTSKAGAVAHFMGEVLFDNLLRHIAGQAPIPAFDGHANCFIETGHGKAMLIDFSYEDEPLPGRFPLPGVGPMTLLEESHVNHVGKLAFKWMYWNLLVRGRDLPFEARHASAGTWS
ncbi:MAG: FAD-dependent oxidoreductase [Myxococcales bacterium]|nr:FAD-dependent oxidoreductase [Myxococcales bacterium]